MSLPPLQPWAVASSAAATIPSRTAALLDTGEPKPRFGPAVTDNLVPKGKDHRATQSNCQPHPFLPYKGRSGALQDAGGAKDVLQSYRALYKYCV